MWSGKREDMAFLQISHQIPFENAVNFNFCESFKKQKENIIELYSFFLYLYELYISVGEYTTWFSLFFWAVNFPMNPHLRLLVSLLAGWLVGQFVGWSLFSEKLNFHFPFG